MAFNYEMKYHTYEAALAKTKEYLTNNDVENGMFYLDKALLLSKELADNSEIVEFKNRFVTENKKLRQIKTNLKEKGVNPFLKKETMKNVSSNLKDEDTPKTFFFRKDPPSITLDDVAGLEDVKKEIKLNVLLPLKNPDLYYKYKDEVGCQILMYGPPGCGKSFVAEAIAGELKCAYAIINAFDILDKYVGEAPKKIKAIFDEASNYDNCLIFFDELDALFSSRESDDSAHTKDVLTSFLTCLSGFNSNKDKKKIRVIIGATNRPWALDTALIRGKRFDTHLYITLPDYDARLFLVKKAFKNHLELLENTDITLEDITERLDGYSGADISSILDKVKTKALEKALQNESNDIKDNVPICKEYFDEVMSSYRNSVSKDSLKYFEEFRNGEI